MRKSSSMEDPHEDLSTLHLPDQDRAAIKSKPKKRKEKYRFRHVNDIPKGAFFEQLRDGIEFGTRKWNFAPFALAFLLYGIFVSVYEGPFFEFIQNNLFLTGVVAAFTFYCCVQSFGKFRIKVSKGKLKVSNGFGFLGLWKSIRLKDIRRVRMVTLSKRTYYGMRFAMSTKVTEDILEIETENKLYRFGGSLPNKSLHYLRYVLVEYLKENKNEIFEKEHISFFE